MKILQDSFSCVPKMRQFLFFEIPSKLFRGLQTELLPLYGNYRYHGCLDRNELIYRFWIYLPFFGGAKPGFLFSQPCVFARFSYLLHRP